MPNSPSAESRVNRPSTRNTGKECSATVAMMGATAIVSPIMVHYPEISPEIMTLAIGSGAIGCTMVTDSLFWLVKQYCGATLNETLKYYTSATFVASLMALAGTFLLSYIV